ncbi:MAG: protein translocase subunit SecD [Chloroflexi bacterium]|nr:protein translocase subunit SecD [Chloroflexota bacterium]
MGVLLLFILALLVVFPVEQGTLGGRGIRLGLDLQGGTRIIYKADLSAVKPGDAASIIDGAIAVMENRVNPLGVTEPSIRKLGSDEILVELPGRSLTDTEKENLSHVAILEFGELVSNNETTRWENEFGKWKPATAMINGEEKILTSQYFLENTYVTRDNLGAILLVFQWNKEGSQLSAAITSRLINQPLGIFEGNQPLRGEDNRPIAPVVRAVITDRGEIDGLSPTEATRLSKLLNTGRLPVPLQRTGDEKTVEAWLGEDFVTKSVQAGIIGILVTMLFMTSYYRVSGLMSSLALVYYAILTLAIFKLLGVTLTLAGIGGFVLSVGMAIDANVLIFERVKEEVWTGRSLGAALDAGFNRAWPAIWDSNITTILAGAILYWLGSTSIIASDLAKGFSVTLIIGVVVSMLTAITVTRTFLRLFVGTGLAHHTSLFIPHQRKADA